MAAGMGLIAGSALVGAYAYTRVRTTANEATSPLGAIGQQHLPIPITVDHCAL